MRRELRGSAGVSPGSALCVSLCVAPLHPSRAARAKQSTCQAAAVVLYHITHTRTRTTYFDHDFSRGRSGAAVKRGGGRGALRDATDQAHRQCRNSAEQPFPGTSMTGSDDDLLQFLTYLQIRLECLIRCPVV